MLQEAISSNESLPYIPGSKENALSFHNILIASFNTISFFRGLCGTMEGMQLLSVGTCGMCMELTLEK